jgi:hypothetical protein
LRPTDKTGVVPGKAKPSPTAKKRSDGRGGMGFLGKMKGHSARVLADF